MCDSFRLHPFAMRHSARYRFGCCANKQLGIWCRWTEKSRQIDQEVCGEFERAGDMGHGLLRIVAHDERVRGQWPGAVGTLFLQTRHACQTEMVVVHDEHLVFLLHQSLLACDPVRAARLSKISVGNGSTERKMVCQFECPIGVKHVAVYNPGASC